MFDTYTITEAEKVARQLMDEHGLRDWKLEITSKVLPHTLGMCIPYYKTIRLSRRCIEENPRCIVRDVILHEIAHALSPGSRHGEEWKEVCEKIGALPERFCAAAVRSHREPPVVHGWKRKPGERY